MVFDNIYESKINNDDNKRMDGIRIFRKRSK